MHPQSLTNEPKISQGPVFEMEDQSTNPESTPQGRAEEDDWTSPNNPADPRNWSLAWKIYHAIVALGVAFEVAFASSIYASGQDSVTQEFQASSTAVLAPYSLFLLGLAFGPVIAAPCSEVFGRKPLYIICVPIFALFTLGAGLSQNIVSLTICRFLAAVFGSPGLSIGAGTVADLWPVEARTVPLACFSLTTFVGPALGALIGGFAVTSHDWRWTQWCILFLTVVLWLPTLGSKETYKPVLMKRRRRNQSPSSQPKVNLQERARYFFKETFIRPLRMLVTEPIVGLFSLYVAFNSALSYVYYSSFSYVFSTIYQFKPTFQGMIFIGTAVGSLAAAFTIALLEWWTNPQALGKDHLGSSDEEKAPEKTLEKSLRHGLYKAMIGSIACPTSLFWFAWTARPAVHWMSPVAALTMFGWGEYLIVMSAAEYITDSYGTIYGASGMAATVFSRSLLATGFPFFAVPLYKALGITWAISLLGFASLALTPIPWLFYHYGDKLKPKAKYCR